MQAQSQDKLRQKIAQCISSHSDASLCHFVCAMGVDEEGLLRSMQNWIDNY